MTLPICDFVCPDTQRFIPTAFIKEPAFAPLADDEDTLDFLARVEMLTSARHAQMMPLPEHVSAQELMAEGRCFGWTYINAAFCYTRPSGGRFNDYRRGAWYAAFGEHARDTGKAEVIFHLERELAATGVWLNTTAYTVLLAGFMAPFHDLRDQRDHPSLNKDLASGYAAGQALAATLRANAGQGVLYPSQRFDGGDCLAAFRPSLVQNVRKGETITLEWTGGPGPLERLKKPLVQAQRP